MCRMMKGLDAMKLSIDFYWYYEQANVKTNESFFKIFSCSCDAVKKAQ